MFINPSNNNTSLMIKTLYFMFFVCAFLLGMMACSKGKENFKSLSADEFERLIQDDRVQCVDVRTVAEYSKGHIPGSLNINVLDDEQFPAAVEELLDPSRPVAVYCKSGRRSRNAATILVKKGYKVYNLDKGYDNWKEFGKDTEL